MSSKVRKDFAKTLKRVAEALEKGHEGRAHQLLDNAIRRLVGRSDARTIVMALSAVDLAVEIEPKRPGKLGPLKQSNSPHLYLDYDPEGSP